MEELETNVTVKMKRGELTLVKGAVNPFKSRPKAKRIGTRTSKKSGSVGGGGVAEGVQTLTKALGGFGEKNRLIRKQTSRGLRGDLEEKKKKGKPRGTKSPKKKKTLRKGFRQGKLPV